MRNSSFATMVFRILFLVVLLTSSMEMAAQLSANFNPDSQGGCSPFTVSFINTTTGASAAATYQWDLGNGNSSTLRTPGGTYKDEKTYTVTLTVKDGGQTSTKTQQITVYKKPTVDFTPDITKGCVPLIVNFTSSATGGDGAITNYFWDFGDGTTQQSATAQIAHSFNFVQKTAVSLTVTNSNGCFNTLKKSDLIQTSAAIAADFYADKTVLCQITDPVKFTNNSTSTPDISYLWDFGDGKTSTEKEPAYVYNKKGTYPVKLTVTSTTGCTKTIEKTAYVNVSNFTSALDVAEPVCQNTNSVYTNKSDPLPTSATWEVDNTIYAYGNTANIVINTPGQHTIKLTNTFGTCQESATKIVTVKPQPLLGGFLANAGGVCGAPVTVQFKDTSTSAVKWKWDFNWYGFSSNISSTIKEPSYTYTSEGYYNTRLIITNADGCEASVTKNIIVSKPNIRINLVKSDNFNNSSACNSLKATFAASVPADVTEYKWDFGDGGTSVLEQPEHQFTKTGNYTVRLNYTTVNGCKDVAYYSYITIYATPNVDFSALQGTTICGNTPVVFTITSPTGNFGTSNYWLINSAPANIQAYVQNGYQFLRDSVYTITLISSNYGCSDTVGKKDYITVLPPFPDIQSATYTCDGTRGTVIFTQNSYKTTQGTWDFGDGTTEAFDPAKTTITHNYTKSGTYKAVLSATSGQCTVRDSIIVNVLLKQKPVLTASLTEVCGSGNLNIQLSNYEQNPNYYTTSYFIRKIEYGDATTYSSSYYYPYFNTSYTNTISNLDNTKKDLRIITTSSVYGCADTSNFISLKIKGPEAKFAIIKNDVCYKTPVIFSDNSTARNNVAITRWTWDYGDGKSATFTNNNPVSYVYGSPNQFPVSLTVTDADGCTATTPLYTKYASVTGPKADFSYYPNSISPNTTVYFNNNTINYNSYATTYLWQFTDGSTSTGYAPSKLYTAVGTDTVKLIAKNASGGCIDTATKVLYIKNINAAFTYTSSYINNNSCPPVVVRFTNTSANVNSVSWNFGDGGTTDNQNFPSHTYYNPGVYYVTLYAVGDNDVTDSTVDSIIIKGPYAIMKADVIMGCDSQTVKLTAAVRNASTYTWDFGDGELKPTLDTFATHTYTVPGIYTPALILKDGTGCAGTSELPDKIIIDSLKINIAKSPQLICDSAQVQFTPVVTSFSEEKLQAALQYKWTFDTGSLTSVDTTELQSRFFNKPGKYPVTLTVASPYGCVKQTSDTVQVIQKVKGSITAKSDVCVDGSISFAGSASEASNAIGWNWTFGNGMEASRQNPAAQTYTSAGNYNVNLVVDYQGCFDTVVHSLIVRPIPNINVQPKQTTICLGKSIPLVASDGVTYTWSPTPGLSSYSVANPIASPVVKSVYTVEAVNQYGCVNNDTATISVAAPFSVAVPKDTFVCIGRSVELYGKGAASYKWIGNVAGLSSITIDKPIATPLVATTYTVVGYDAFGCFSDTQRINVAVRPYPTVNAGPNVEMQTGSTLQLNARSSSDVVSWNWSPGNYLSCIDCQTPVTAPRTAIDYIVKATNQYGCAVSDTLRISLVCNQKQVYIPTAFTPNQDYKNDIFYIMGGGVKIIKYLKIYNRAGEAVFQKVSINIDDRSAGWNGKYKGVDQPAGTYVYMTEMICDTGETFSFNGTVVLIR